MRALSHLAQRVLKLDPPVTRDVTVERDLRVPMPDGTVLLADRWAPRSGGDGLPLVLVRSPYGRRGPVGVQLGRVPSERGFQVLIQSVRGTHGSGGVFDPMRQERDDGLTTLKWAVEQPWCGESVVLAGASYLGYAQWAVADQLPPQVKALIPHMTESALTLEFLRHDGLSLETPFTWGVNNAVAHPAGVLRGLARIRRKQRALDTLPLGQADIAATGERVEYIQDILSHDAQSPRWNGLDHRHRVPVTNVPVSSIGGWFDVFLPGQLRDFQALQDAGREARLTIGPWTHANLDNTPTRELLTFGLALARGKRPPERPPVRLYVMGEEAWADFASWPPPGYRPTPFHLRTDGGLSTEVPTDSASDRYRYDPADPTPALGGVRASAGGRKDNAKLEARPDVLTYTTRVLDEDVEVVGEVSARIWFRSDLPFADVFVRLCDVDEQGRSSNVCDGLVSHSDADELSCVAVRLWPTAYRFRRGHRIRVQVSSGAFPRFARNPGTGEPIATATELRAAEQEVHHGPGRLSAIVLPVLRGS
jgi:putative CocE/NonD family hydrolase